MPKPIVHDLWPLNVARSRRDAHQGELQDFWLSAQVVWVWWSDGIGSLNNLDNLVCDAYRERLKIQFKVDAQKAIAWVELSQAAVRSGQYSPDCKGEFWHVSRMRIVARKGYALYRLVFEKAEPIYKDGQPYPMANLYRQVALQHLNAHA